MDLIGDCVATLLGEVLSHRALLGDLVSQEPADVLELCDEDLAVCVVGEHLGMSKELLGHVEQGHLVSSGWGIDVVVARGVVQRAGAACLDEGEDAEVEREMLGVGGRGRGVGYDVGDTTGRCDGAWTVGDGGGEDGGEMGLEETSCFVDAAALDVVVYLWEYEIRQGRGDTVWAYACAGRCVLARAVGGRGQR